MPLSMRKFAALSLYAASPVLADFLGARYVPPRDLSSDDSIVSAAWKNATSIIEQSLTANGSTMNEVTFSLGMFSLYDENAPKLQYHHTSPEIMASNGTHKVDSDSIYRIASISKVFTVLAGLLKLNDSDWERPLTDVFPNLLGEYEKRRPAGEDPVNRIPWEKVTLSALSAHQAGLTVNPLAMDIAVSLMKAQKDETTLGLPPLNVSSPLVVDALSNLADSLNDVPPTPENFIPQHQAMLPNFPVWTQPQYSNIGFVLLTGAITAIAGEKLSSLSQKSILDPLGMSASYYNVVPESERQRSVIASDEEWALETGIFEGSGGLASSTNDLAKFGIGLLNYTIMSPEATRRWMKPVGHTGRFQFSMGRPWEIIRYTYASGAVTDLYTKAGESGSYLSYLVIIPEYEAGFTILGAASDPTSRAGVIPGLGDLLANVLLPALEEQAAVETERKFAGTYESTEEGLNSSMVLCWNKTAAAAPGLLVKSIIANSTDISAGPLGVYAPGARLTPSIYSPETKKYAFRANRGSDAPLVDVTQTLFTSSGGASWITGDAGTYNGASLGQMVFNINDKGEAESITPTFLDDTWKKSAEAAEC